MYSIEEILETLEKWKQTKDNKLFPLSYKYTKHDVLKITFLYVLNDENEETSIKKYLNSLPYPKQIKVRNKTYYPKKVKVYIVYGVEKKTLDKSKEKN